MVKQLIPAAISLLIDSNLEAIHYAGAVLDFLILARYTLHDDKTLAYMENALYILYKIKMVLKKHRPVDEGLFWPIFNYSKFHAIRHFVQCICKYGSVLNYDTAYSEAANKYVFKAFYRRTNKKEYESQILRNNIRYTKIVAIHDFVIVVKINKKK